MLSLLRLLTNFHFSGFKHTHTHTNTLAHRHITATAAACCCCHKSLQLLFLLLLLLLLPSIWLCIFHHLLLIILTFFLLVVYFLPFYAISHNGNWVQRTMSEGYPKQGCLLSSHSRSTVIKERILVCTHRSDALAYLPLLRHRQSRLLCNVKKQYLNNYFSEICKLLLTHFNQFTPAMRFNFFLNFRSI